MPPKLVVFDIEYTTTMRCLHIEIPYKTNEANFIHGLVILFCACTLVFGNS